MEEELEGGMDTDHCKAAYGGIMSKPGRGMSIELEALNITEFTMAEHVYCPLLEKLREGKDSTFNVCCGKMVPFLVHW